MPFRPPLEVAMEILEWTALDPYRGGIFYQDQQTLLACTQVSRVWHTHAQRILFRKIRLKGADNDLEYKHAFNNLVQRLVRLHKEIPTTPILREIQAVSLGFQSSYHSTTADLDSVPKLLSLTPNLKALHITLLPPDLEIPDLFSFKEEQLLAIKAAPCASGILHLSMRSHISDPLILQQLLSVLPAVDTLTLEAPRHSTTYADGLKLPALKALVLDEHISRKCVAYLMNCTMPALRTLVIASLSDLARVHTYFSPFVQDLAVFDAPFEADGLLDQLVDFPKLQSLVIGFDMPRALLDRIAMTVATFGFDPYLVRDLDAVLDWLDSRLEIQTVGTVFHPEIDNERETQERGRVKSYCAANGKRYTEIYRVCLSSALCIPIAEALSR